jgi:cytochrome oxidase assembly protein ShyY1
MEFTQSNAKSVLLLVCTVVVVSLCSGLAIWQYKRSQEKQQLSEQFSLLAEQGIVPWHKVNNMPKDWVSSGLKVSLSGVLAEQYWWLDNQVVEGRFGYDLIVAVRPKGEYRWWLVNLGWYAGDYRRTQLPNITLPEQVSVTGTLKVDGFKGFSLASDNEAFEGNRTQFITPQLAATSLQQEVAPYIVYADQQTAFGQYHYKALNMSSDKHLAYALQWILLALAGLVVGVVLYRKGVNNE